MKKFIVLITLATMLSCTSCGGKTENSTPTSSSSSNTTESSTIDESTTTNESTTVGESSENGSSAEEPSEKDEDYFNWFGINTYLPSEYYVNTTEGFPQASINDDEGILTNIVYYTMHDDSVEQIPEAVKEYMYSNAMQSYIISAEKRGAGITDNEIESEEKVHVNGCDFIRQAGIYHTTDFIEDTDFAYVAYFGAMDFPEEGVQPAVFIAFSHHTDDEMKAELARLADTIAKDAKPIE